MVSRKIETHMRTIRINNFYPLALLALMLLLNACASWLPEAHHIEIQQGNVIKQAERDALRTGMTKKEVQDLLGKAILRDYINATIGFDALGSLTDKSPKSLMRMLGPKGNPQARNLFEIIAHLQKREGIHFEVRTVR